MTNPHPYADILNATRPEPSSRHPRMETRERAGQFGSFAALVGYEKAVAALATGNLAPEEIDAFVEAYFGEVLDQEPPME